MNAKEYITSGIVETCVLGIATDAEREAFEAMCKLHPEVEQARLQFELLLETRLLQEAVPPPPEVKDRLLDFIEREQSGVASAEEETPKTPVRRLSIWKIITAASVLLLAGALFWAFSFYNEHQQLKKANADLLRQIKNHAAQLQQLQQLQADARMMQSPAVKMAALKGTEKAAGAFTTVFWDTASKDVYLMINNLPQPAPDKQYQLWALLNNQPVDLGVFDVLQERLLVKMKNVQNAQAFAITLEPKGGSPLPTVEAMYAIGKL